MKHFSIHIALALIFTGYTISSCCNGFPPTATSASTSATLKISAEYSGVYKRMADGNKETGPMNNWFMSSEHLFVGDPDLCERIIQFSRKDGAIDFLFTKFLDSKTSDDEVLLISEFLVYFVEMNQPKDQWIHSRLSDQVLDAVRQGRLDTTLRKNPDGAEFIKNAIVYAALKAHPLPTTKPNSH